jgi:hypothetical protein
LRETASGAKTDGAQLRRVLDQLEKGNVLMITIYARDSAVPIRSEILNATVRPQHLAASSPFAGK